MKTALVYPYSKIDYIACKPPISILYLAASLKENGEDVLVFDKDDGGLSDSDIMKELIEYSPDLIGIPLFPTTLTSACNLIELLKCRNNSWKIVAGGPYATARPHDVLKIFKGCDYVLRGEAEQSIVELAKCIEGNHNLSSVNGLSYRNGNDIVHNPDAVLNMDLDSIPFPARDLLRNAYRKKTYWEIGYKGSVDLVITSRGCPYSCNFCFNPTKKIRVRSPKNVIEELICIKMQGIHSVHIKDDFILHDKYRYLELLDLIKKLKLNMEFGVITRSDSVDEELLLAMKNAGVKSVLYGLESGSQKILDMMNKKTTVEMNYKAVLLTKKAGLRCYASVILGYPGETPKTIKETEKMLLETKPTAIRVSLACPLPGTKLYDEAKKQGILEGDWDVNCPEPWLKLPWIKDEKMLFKYRDKIIKKFLCNPIVIFNVFRFILFRISFSQLRILLSYFLENTAPAIFAVTVIPKRKIFKKVKQWWRPSPHLSYH